MSQLVLSLTTVLLLGSWQPTLALRGPQTNDERTISLTKEQWRQDLQFLARELAKRHKNAFHTITREQFERAVAELDAAIPALQDHEVPVRMLMLTAMIGDGHTYVHLPKSFHDYPLTLYWFGDELRVTRTVAPYERALGARVVRIGETEIKDADARVRRVISQSENEWFVLRNSADYITVPEVLYTLGITPDVAQAAFTFQDAEGKQFTLNLRPAALGAKLAWLLAVKELPLYRQRPDERFWFTYLADSQIVYVSFRGYDSLGENAQKLFSFIDRNPTTRLVIDMRSNTGGDYTKVRRYLLPELKRRDGINKPGHLFVIIGRRTFSAAMNNAADFRKETKAILVGEPTGARPNGYQENDEMKLPNSRLTVSYSTRYYKFQDEDTPAVMPDKMIEPNWESYKAGRDPVMEWILNYPSNK
ncbi:MAG: hypothetical protein ABR501_05480 [Pyrinomonadaceae bacterium]